MTSGIVIRRSINYTVIITIKSPGASARSAAGVGSGRNSSYFL